MRLVLFVIALTIAAPAQAGAVLGVETNWRWAQLDDRGVHISRGPVEGGSVGADLRLGYRVGLPLWHLTPEVGAGYHHFPAPNQDAGDHLFRGYAGGRMGLGAVIEPSVFAHGGFGVLTGPNTFERGPHYRGGLALDFTPIPKVDVGVQAAYNLLTPTTSDGAVHWLTAGVGLGVHF